MDSKVTQDIQRDKEVWTVKLHKTYNDAIKNTTYRKHGPKQKREKAGGMRSLNPGKFLKGRQFRFL